VGGETDLDHAAALVAAGTGLAIWSDLMAAPVQGLGSGLGSMFGGSGFDSIAGDGLNPVMLVALAGWSVVEVLVMGVVREFDQV
jgi:hypothetical protein